MTRYGYLLPTFEDTDPVALGVRAEEAGFDSVWVPDSPFVYGLPDPLLVLAGLATTTTKVTLGTGVLLAALRQPVLLAHSLATLHRLSGGRLVVGLGSAFGSPATERQFAAAGVPFTGRTGRLTETIEVLRAVWSGKPFSHGGQDFTLDDFVLSPAPPIWLAGAGATAERRAGRLGDGWLPYPPTARLYAEGWDRVRGAAEARTPTAGLYATVALDSSVDVAQDRLRTTVERWYGAPYPMVSSRQAMFAGTPAGLRDWLASYVDAGAQYVVLRAADENPRRGLDALAGVIR